MQQTNLAQGSYHSDAATDAGAMTQDFNAYSAEEFRTYYERHLNFLGRQCHEVCITEWQDALIASHSTVIIKLGRKSVVDITL